MERGPRTRSRAHPPTHAREGQPRHSRDEEAGPRPHATPHWVRIQLSGFRQDTEAPTRPAPAPAASPHAPAASTAQRRLTRSRTPVLPQQQAQDPEEARALAGPPPRPCPARPSPCPDLRCPHRFCSGPGRAASICPCPTSCPRASIRLSPCRTWLAPRGPLSWSRGSPPLSSQTEDSLWGSSG